MATSNICNYTPMINLSLRGINHKFSIIHRYLCAIGGGGTGLTSVSTQDSASVTWTGDGTSGNPLIATASSSGNLQTITDSGNETSNAILITGVDNFAGKGNGLYLLHLPANYSQIYSGDADGGTTLPLLIDATSTTITGSTRTNGNVGIDIAALYDFHMENTTAIMIAVNTTAVSGTSGGKSYLYTKGLPSASNHELGGIFFGSRGGASNEYVGASIRALSNGAWSAGTNHQGAIIFSVTASGNATPAVGMRLGGSGRLFVGGNTVATATLHLAAGAAAASSAPLKFTTGTNLTTAEAGAMEYNGTNLFFTRVGTTRENVVIASAVTTEIVVANTTVTVNINGVDYKLLAVTV